MQPGSGAEHALSYKPATRELSLLFDHFNSSRQLLEKARNMEHPGTFENILEHWIIMIFAGSGLGRGGIGSAGYSFN